MINADLITYLECENEGTVIHLYHDDTCDDWTSYGISAYILYHMASKSLVNIFYGFSDDIQMPYVNTNICMIEKLFRGCPKEYSKSMNHLEISLSGPINLDDYVRWAKYTK